MLQTLKNLLAVLLLLRRLVPVNVSFMKHVPKDTTDEALIQEYLNKGGKVSKGKTKPLNPSLGLSKNVWNQTLSKEEKAARDKK